MMSFLCSRALIFSVPYLSNHLREATTVSWGLRREAMTPAHQRVLSGESYSILGTGKPWTQYIIRFYPDLNGKRPRSATLGAALLTRLPSRLTVSTPKLNGSGFKLDSSLVLMPFLLFIRILLNFAKGKTIEDEAKHDMMIDGNCNIAGRAIELSFSNGFKGQRID
ncbi:hypothetical protein MRB53_002106 [Persea americana]|uniref:Uncharacterized protein n=1 Tax=Persea americana TaxID=3435 RepID=A0ACC2MU68_PERAE|nr:hypothetical protein MRB53_002106 [Persea americana]